MSNNLYELTQCVQWNSIFFKQPLQDILFPCFTECLLEKPSF